MVAKRGKNAMVHWEKQMEEQAARSAAIEERALGGGNFISIRGGQLSYRGAKIPDNKMRVVILASVFENQYYGDREFDPDNPSSPVCYSFSEDGKQMVPHEASPEKQCDACKDCGWMEFGTAKRGRGKACKEVRRIAMITEGDLENIEDAMVAYLKVPVTSVKSWAGYVNQISSTLKRPTFGVITEIGVVPDPKNQLSVTFRFVEKIEDAAVFEQIMELKEKVDSEIAFAYPLYEEQENAKKKTKTSAVKSKTTTSRSRAAMTRDSKAARR